MRAKQIAIDGPAGAGKSTVARQVAAKMDYLYIDTGAMYRAVALMAVRRGIAFDDGEALTAIAQTVDIVLQNKADCYQVYCNGEDVSAEIRRPDVGSAASPVSAVAGVREALVAQQQHMAEQGGVVMDGRDIGTKVLPNADCKIFLTAPLEVRAQRRTDELTAKGVTADYRQIFADMEERDYRDSHRQHSPLCQAADAVYLDTAGLTIEQVVKKIISLAGGQE